MLFVCCPGINADLFYFGRTKGLQHSRLRQYFCDHNQSLIQWSGRFLGIIGSDPSVYESNRLHVDILQFSFIKLGYILYKFLKSDW